MAAHSAVIVGIGMTTAVGLTAAEVAASVRAGAARFSETDFHDKRFDRFTVAEVPEDGLAPLMEGLERLTGLTTRERRMLRLAAMPLRECVAPLGVTRERPALCLALPETETARPLDRAAFLQLLAVQVDGVFDPARSDAGHVGRAGGLAALGQAVLAIEQGVAELVLAGGVDSYNDPYVLATLDREQRVKSNVNHDGFVPGEGAGFLLLASEHAAAARGLRPLARVSPPALGLEPGHLYSDEPYRGDGLAATFAQLAAMGVPRSPALEVFSSMNGESHWAKEWGVGYLRNKAAFDPGHAVHHPADCFGDSGAACGPLMAGLAALGMRDQYRRSPAIVYASSDHGQRTAVVLST